MPQPKYLYKYKPFGEFLFRELANQEVFFCRPQDFNDPLDCKPPLANDIDLKRLERFAYQILLKRTPERKDWAVSRINDYRYGATEFGRYDDGKEGERYYTRSLLGIVEDDLLEAMGDRGVLSLSRKWDSMLMWSHYANNHKGVCLEFAFADNRCENLQPVDYESPRGISVKDLYRWRLQSDLEAEARIRRRYFFTKSRDWKYEAEWRATQLPAGVAPSPFHLRSIHFGARCDPSLITTIIKLFSGSKIDPRFYEVYLDNDRAKLRRTVADTGYLDAFGVQESAVFREEQAMAMFNETNQEMEEPVADLPAEVQNADQ